MLSVVTYVFLIHTWLILISKTPKRKNSNQLMALRETNKDSKEKRSGKKIISPTGNNIQYFLTAFYF